MESVEAMKFAENHVGVAEVLRFCRRVPEKFEPLIDEARKALASPF